MFGGCSLEHCMGGRDGYRSSGAANSSLAASPWGRREGIDERNFKIYTPGRQAAQGVWLASLGEAWHWLPTPVTTQLSPHSARGFLKVPSHKATGSSCPPSGPWAQMNSGFSENQVHRPKVLGSSAYAASFLLENLGQIIASL